MRIPRPRACSWSCCARRGRGRLALTLRLSNAMIAASRRAIRKRHPELSEQEVRLLWAELHYGKELADRVRAHLAKRAR